MIREIVFYGRHFLEFYALQDLKIQRKIEFVLDLIRFENQVPTKFFKALGSEGIYEIRVITSSKSIRILCFFDKGNIVVLLNCFVKKSQKTPKREIRRAVKLKRKYRDEKRHN